MDPFSAEGELTNLHTAFHTSQHSAVLSFDTSALSPSNQLPARILQLRSKIALKQYDEVISDLEGEDDVADLAAVKAFAEYQKEHSSESISRLDGLAAGKGDNATVQLCAATVMAREGREGEALTLLGRHQGSLDAVALIVQIHLAMNRLDVAQQEVRKARNWAQDHLLVNLAEAWVGLREGGPKYQPAFYVYEELATAPPSIPVSSGSTTSNTTTLLGQSICELHLGRLPEAEAAMTQALEQEPENADILANAVVLNTVAGKYAEAKGFRERLERVDPKHELVIGLEDKMTGFDAAKSKYNPVFEAPS